MASVTIVFLSSQSCPSESSSNRPVRHLASWPFDPFKLRSNKRPDVKYGWQIGGPWCAVGASKRHERRLGILAAQNNNSFLPRLQSMTSIRFFDDSFRFVRTVGGHNEHFCRMRRCGSEMERPFLAIQVLVRLLNSFQPVSCVLPFSVQIGLSWFPLFKSLFNGAAFLSKFYTKRLCMLQSPNKDRISIAFVRYFNVWTVSLVFSVTHIQLCVISCPR